MYNFWNNVYKFPRFLIAVMIGFFLTTFRPVFKSLKNKKVSIIKMLIIIFICISIYLILKEMTE
uniref:Uncharacterized protein ycf33 n=1 Tax=Dasya naccarioides TaxID=2007180 RepID=A0A1Z1MHG2_9FLOR|nr:hypothetical protein [Dasya naccarioides]ARW65255.1 hypothetical protein [Dasya naccarioides]